MGEQRAHSLRGLRATLPVDYCLTLFAKLVIVIEYDQDAKRGEEGDECEHYVGLSVFSPCSRGIQRAFCPSLILQ